MIGIAFKNSISFFFDLYRCDSRSWALNCWSSVSISRFHSTEVRRSRQEKATSMKEERDELNSNREGGRTST